MSGHHFVKGRCANCEQPVEECETDCPATRARIVRALQANNWRLVESDWRVDLFESQANKDFCATLYFSTANGCDREFVEGRGDTKQEALDALREAAEAAMTRLKNALGFDWKLE